MIRRLPWPLSAIGELVSMWRWLNEEGQEPHDVEDDEAGYTVDDSPETVARNRHEFGVCSPFDCEFSHG